MDHTEEHASHLIIGQERRTLKARPVLVCCDRDLLICPLSWLPMSLRGADKHVSVPDSFTFVSGAAGNCKRRMAAIASLADGFSGGGSMAARGAFCSAGILCLLLYRSCIQVTSQLQCCGILPLSSRVVLGESFCYLVYVLNALVVSQGALFGGGKAGAAPAGERWRAAVARPARLRAFV